MKLKIKVTQNDINHGRRKDCNRCPIARAVKRAVTKSKVKCLLTKIAVRLEEVILLDSWGSVDHRGYLPSRAQRFIIKFDDAKDTKPFNFILNLT